MRCARGRAMSRRGPPAADVRWRYALVVGGVGERQAAASWVRL
jgi:hypothetical protein